MDISFRIDGLDKIQNATRQVQVEVEKEIRKALFASAKRVEGEAKRSIAAGGKSGRVYKRGNVSHQASAPGEAPATDTGRLINSINPYQADTKLESTVIAGRGTVKYASWLEYGTKHIAARPFMFPSLEKSRQWTQERLAKAVRDAVTKPTR
jgi:Bacteriophage HK97-gp10, putative tail-component